jgi:hypothetical protein
LEADSDASLVAKARDSSYETLDEALADADADADAEIVKLILSLINSALPTAVSVTEVVAMKLGVASS